MHFICFCSTLRITRKYFIPDFLCKHLAKTLEAVSSLKEFVQLSWDMWKIITCVDFLLEQMPFKTFSVWAMCGETGYADYKIWRCCFMQTVLRWNLDIMHVFIRCRIRSKFKRMRKLSFIPTIRDWIFGWKTRWPFVIWMKHIIRTIKL